MEARIAYKKWWITWDDSLQAQNQITDVEIVAVTRRHDEEDYKEWTFIQTWKGMLEGYASFEKVKATHEMIMIGLSLWAFKNYIQYVAIVVGNVLFLGHLPS